MTLSEFSSDVVPIVQMILTALGLLSLFLVWWQIREARLWNKLHTEQNYFDARQDLALEKEVVDSLKEVGIVARETFEPLSPEQLTSIVEDDRAYLAVKSYLNSLENLGAAVCVGAADPDLAYAVHSSRVVRAYKVFEPFLDQLREKHNDDVIYVELEKTALAWDARQQLERPIQEKKIQELKSQAINTRGVQQKV